MAKARDERHRYGQHYTPQAVARLLAALAVKSETDFVFDPSCGDGRLLRAAMEIKHCIAEERASSQTAESPIASNEVSLFGIDRSAMAVAQASMPGLAVAVADFFEIEPGDGIADSVSLPQQFDSIIGNPPYIRQEIMSSADKQRVRRSLSRNGHGAYQPAWSRRSDMYVYFFARAIDFLRHGGSLAFLTASSWMSVGYGEHLKEFFLENFRIIAVIESVAESFFADASVNTAITVLEREPDPQLRDSHSVRFVQLRAPLAQLIPDGGPDETIRFARLIRTVTDSSPHFRAHVVRQGLLRERCESRSGMFTPQRTPDVGSMGFVLSDDIGGIGESNWSVYTHADDVFFRIRERCRAVLRPLGGMAAVRFGIKTGANEFFYVRGRDAGNSSVHESHTTRELPRSPGLKPLREIAIVRRGLTTGANEFFYVAPRTPSDVYGQRHEQVCDIELDPDAAIEVEDRSGARHQIERRYLSPVVFSLKEITGIRLTISATRRLVFSCSEREGALAATNALKYIRSGERAGYHRRPTCAARDPWYTVGRGWKPAPLIFPSKVGERWLIAINEARVLEDKKLYGIFPNRPDITRALAAFLNSTWARYFAEMTSRQMTGAQAIADIDVVVAAQILLPDPDDLTAEQLGNLDTALDDLSGRQIFSIFEEAKRADRRKLDDVVLAVMGFTNPVERAQVLQELYEAVTELVRSRLDRSHRAKSGASNLPDPEVYSPK